MGGSVGKKRAIEKKSETTGSSLTINLFGPGMTALHKVGLAGLWMTLEAFEGDQQAMDRLHNTGGSWERNDTSVTLNWNGASDPFFKALFKESFKLDNNGLLWFPALGEPMDHPQHAVILQEAILGSFLQHGQTRKTDPSQNPQGLISIDVDEVPLRLRFHRISWFAHQNVAKFSATGSNNLAGWHLPGGAVRHVGLGQSSTALEESPEGALALWFAPIGAVYFVIPRPGRRKYYTLVLPEVSDLEKYAQVRACFLRYGVQQLYLAGTADAGLRVLTELDVSGLLEDIDSAFCRTISFGTVPWSSQQKTRLELFTVRPGSKSVLRTFRLCQHFFKPQLVKHINSDPSWDIPQIPDMVARNLSQGQAWWKGFSDFVADQEVRDHVFGYIRDRRTKKLIGIRIGEKGGLATMLEDKEVFPDSPERTFVLACHEAWRRRLGQLGNRARREDASFHDLANREFERLRVAVSRCKNAASLREAVTNFWARSGGSLPSLQAGWRDVISLLEEKNWRKAKDLTLLALASYKPETKEEKEGLTHIENSDLNGDK